MSAPIGPFSAPGVLHDPGHRSGPDMARRTAPRITAPVLASLSEGDAAALRPGGEVDGLQFAGLRLTARVVGVRDPSGATVSPAQLTHLAPALAADLGLRVED